ncbi:ABC transporter permease subunit [Pseudobdellovibrio exovorus]|uniref:Peptide ABC transporter, permease protein n=1 Tax=Pseudobdellovibrio exovorus JSS TaxID=1184267 RepID=M4VEJ0_9BACT|nr:ABC transporter permease subunit [Pseudobdellovibrio exovorus]AGH96451.1 peptide ABC transporter, permease protein [Pseudobdellovibrio exovorus JSS]
MLVYILRRLLLAIPTFLGITLLTFLIINAAPGGPIEQKLQQIRMGGGGDGGSSVVISQEILDNLSKQYGFDKPVYERYWIWLKNISRLDFGESFTYQEPVIDVITQKFPVSLSFGLASLFLTYLVCIPLGVKKAINVGSRFDHISGIVLYGLYSVPVLVSGILLIVWFAGGSHFDLFPIGNLYSDDYDTLSTWGKFTDRIHHFILPLTCYMLGNFTELTMLVRSSMLDVTKSDYIRTARSKGLADNVVYFKHALRNALIPVATGLGGFLRVFLAGSLIIERIFNLDGIGLLSYNSILSRDYNVIMGITFISALLLLAGNIISDIIYVLVDPRIDFK